MLDSAVNFHARYWLRHGVAVWGELPLYAVRKGRFNAAAQCLAAEAAYCCMLAALWRLNAVATLWVFLLPFVISSFALMFGNWCAARTHCHRLPVACYEVVMPSRTVAASGACHHSVVAFNALQFNC